MARQQPLNRWDDDGGNRGTYDRGGPPPEQHEAWSRADESDQWGRQQAAWDRGVVGSQRGQAPWSTWAPDGETPRADAYRGQRPSRPSGQPVEERPSYRGKGPKSFARSDEQLRYDVCQRLSDHDDVDATDIDVHVENGEATLIGTVPERQMKRLAEDCAEGCIGISNVQNNLRLAPATKDTNHTPRG